MEALLTPHSHTVTFKVNRVKVDLQRDLYGDNLCDMKLQFLADRWIRTTINSESGEVEQVEVPFERVLVYDEIAQTVDYGLYLLINQYRYTKDPAVLATINGALSQFPFSNSMAGYVLQLSDIN